MISSLFRIPRRNSKRKTDLSGSFSPIVSVHGASTQHCAYDDDDADSDNLCLFKSQVFTLYMGIVCRLPCRIARKLIKIMAFLCKTSTTNEWNAYAYAYTYEQSSFSGFRIQLGVCGDNDRVAIYHIQMEPHAKRTKSVFGNIFEMRESFFLFAFFRENVALVFPIFPCFPFRTEKTHLKFFH